MLMTTEEEENTQEYGGFIPTALLSHLQRNLKLGQFYASFFAYVEADIFSHVGVFWW